MAERQPRERHGWMAWQRLRRRGLVHRDDILARRGAMAAGRAISLRRTYLSGLGSPVASYTLPLMTIPNLTASSGIIAPAAIRANDLDRITICAKPNVYTLQPTIVASSGKPKTFIGTSQVGWKCSRMNLAGTEKNISRSV